MSEHDMTSAPVQWARQFVVSRRFEGFPGIANGGYLAGLFHRELGGTVEVTLRRPIPVETSLTMRRASVGAAEIWDASTLLARAVRDDAQRLEPPPVVGFDAAVAARDSYRGRAEMPVETCFVCGVQRSPADALRLFAGELAPGRVAAAWIPGPAFGDDRGEVHTQHVIAALDCPGGWAVVSADTQFRAPMVLGRVWVRSVAPVRVGLPYVVVGAATGHEQRKHFASTAVYDAQGGLRAVARSVWFPRPRELSRS